MLPSNVIGLTDLPDEILLIIFQYLEPIDVLRIFFVNHISDRFYRLTIKHRLQINLSVLSYSDFRFLMDAVFPRISPSYLRLNNIHIPCLFDQFLESSKQLSFTPPDHLHLIGCLSQVCKLTLFLSRQSSLKALIIHENELEDCMLTGADVACFRDYFFNRGSNPLVSDLQLQVPFGFVFGNRSSLVHLPQLNNVSLAFATIDDLKVLLSKGILSNVSKMQVELTGKRQEIREEELVLQSRNKLLEFSILECNSGTKYEELTNLICHMPIIRKLTIVIGYTECTSFAHFSCLDHVIPDSVIDYHFFARIDAHCFQCIVSEMNDQCLHRFPMRRLENKLYTVPWRLSKISVSIPLTDYHQTYVDSTKAISILRENNPHSIGHDKLKPWKHVTTIISDCHLPFPELFPYLRVLQTANTITLLSPLPPTLRILILTDNDPIPFDVLSSPVVHKQVIKFILHRMIRNENDLVNVLHQFPNLRFLTLTLPSTNSKDYLYHIFDDNNPCLPHLVCLQVYGGEFESWRIDPLKWLREHTPLKHRSIRFYATFSSRNQRLIIWL